MARTGDDLALPDPFTYLDYREYLRAAYVARRGKGGSHRSLARRAGLRSPSFLKAVMEGRRNLAPTTASRVASALSLYSERAEYFCALVAFNQAKEPAERRVALARLRRLRRHRDVRALEAARDAYHATWYLPAIRELAASDLFRADPAWIARVLRPRITVREAEQAIAALEKLGLLVPDEGGVPRPVSAQVTTELEPKSADIARFHRTMITRALEAIDVVPRPERDISSITLCVDREGLIALKRRIQQIRDELLDEFDAGARGAQVLQVNFQLFPLSERIGPRGI